MKYLKNNRETDKLNLLVVIPRIVSRAGEWYQPPMGIAYILAVLKENGYHIHTINLNDSDEKYTTRIKEIINKFSIDGVLTGGVTGQYTAIYDIVSTVKKINNNIFNIVGGGIISSTPYEAMEALEFVDYGVINEGEIVVIKLLEALENNTNIEDVPSIIYKKKPPYKNTSNNLSELRKKYYRTIVEVPKVDINSLPFPDYDGIGYGKLIKSIPNILGMSELKTLPIVTSRGCPFKCTFCFQPDGESYRVRSMDDVFEEIDYLIKEYDLKYLILIDELFGANQKRVEEFCERIRPYNIKWTGTFRIPQITESNVKLLKQSNFHTASLGIESMDNDILKSMKKKIKREQTENALKLLYNEGIGIQGVLIFGDPEETKESAKNTLDWWMKNVEYDIQLSAIIPYPGTPVYTHGIKKGIISNPIQYIKDGCPLVKLSNHMSDKDYAWLFQQILSLPRERYSFPKNYKLTHLDFKNAKIVLSGQCVHCGNENIWEGVRSFMLESMTCVDCGRRHIAPIPEEFKNNVIKNYELIYKKFGISAFWGINSYFYSFIKSICSKLSNFHLVDRGESRIGVSIENCEKNIVKDPSIIDKDKIECIIVTVPSYFSNIKSSVLNSHSSVKSVISIVDLVSNDFNIELLNQKSNETIHFNQPDLETSVKGK